MNIKPNKVMRFLNKLYRSYPNPSGRGKNARFCVHYYMQEEKKTKQLMVSIKKDTVIVTIMIVVQKLIKFVVVVLQSLLHTNLHFISESNLTVFITQNFYNTALHESKGSHFKRTNSHVCYAYTLFWKMGWMAKRVFWILTANCSCYNS